jgi:single-strand DNA-binding protein
MSHATGMFSGVLVRVKPETDDRNKEYLKGLLIIEEGKSGILLEVYGKAMEEIAKLKDLPIVVVGSARFAPDSKQSGLKNDLVINVRQFAICDGVINNVDITGTLGKDPEYKVFDSGKGKAFFSLAVNTWPHKDASWFDIDAWEKDAETITNYCRKGHALSIPFAIGRKTKETMATDSGRLAK